MPAETSGRLPVRVPRGEGEPAYSLFERLAAEMGARSPAAFAAELGLDLRDVRSGRATRRLAGLAGLEPEALDLATFAVGEHSVSIRSAGIDRNHWSCLHPRVCPECRADDLVEHGFAWHRSWWDVIPLRRCHVHGVPLVRRDGAAPARAEAGARGAAAGAGGEAYVLGRIGFAPAAPCDLLDRLPVSRAIDLLELVGAGESGRWGLRDPRRVEASGLLSAGYAILSGGASTFLRHLDGLVATAPAPRDHLGPGSVYGRLYRWLSSENLDPAFAEVRTLVREHALSRLPIPAGQPVLGEAAQNQAIFSLAQAAGRMVVQKALARRFLAAVDARPIQALGNSELYAAPDVEKAVTLHATTLWGAQARTLLGLSGDALGSLVKEGCLPVALGARATGTRDDRFRTEDVRRLLDAVTRDLPLLPSAPEGTRTLVAAGRSAMSSTGELVRAILDRRLRPTGRLAGMSGLAGVLVEVRAVFALHAAAARRQDVVAWEEVVRAVGRKSVADALVRGGHLSRTTAEMGFRNRRRQVVSRREWSRFQARYVSAAELARTRRTSVAALVRHLAASGVAPAFPAADGRRYFERRQLASCPAPCSGTAERRTVTSEHGRSGGVRRSPGSLRRAEAAQRCRRVRAGSASSRPSFDDVGSALVPNHSASSG